MASSDTRAITGKTQRLSAQESGRIDGLRYDELAPILINEAQEQQQRIAAQDAQIRALKEEQLRDRRQQLAELTDLRQELHAALLKLAPKEKVLSRR